jgi:dolichol-phosphate mannosyltransferase
VKLSVIIPCYNEEATIASALEAVLAVDLPKEIIVVDDGSTDRTREIAESYAGHGEIKVIVMPANRGKGSAIREALGQVTGDIVMIQDADLEYDPQQIPKLIAPIVDGETDVVYGSRFLGSIKGMRLPNLIANRILAWLAGLLFRARITDEATCYKAFRAETIISLDLKCKRFEFCPEVTAKLLKRGVKILELPISYVGRTAAQGKKIGWRDGLEAIWTLVKYRFRD